MHSVGWIGLGTMGFPMAKHVAKALRNQRLFVWNRNAKKAEMHAKEVSSVVCSSIADVSENAEVIFLCLPSSTQVAEVVQHISGKCHIIVDCTSGDPTKTREIGAELSKRGISLVDCPVSGGPLGAENATLTTMFGGDKESVEIAMSLSAFAKVKEHVGPLAAGHAVKAINNMLNCIHLLAATEGLLALSKFGVPPEKALDCINMSSGRSLQTEVRVPQEVLTRKFNYGFKLGLMEKDVHTARNIQDNVLPESALLFPLVEQLVKVATEKYGATADYTNISRVLEDRAGFVLQSAEEVADKDAPFDFAPYLGPRKEPDTNTK
eukprot:GEMP01020707.1.p1 GENE.GEMP01020707.1~~GEMP01020707.1.p1  ORF type:complete len:322 (+),score=78.72 GEMP01020707.1:212-1177(+)